MGAAAIPVGTGNHRPGRQAFLATLARQMRNVAPARDPALFTEFLPLGYERMTLSTVQERLLERVLQTKVRIGALITLYDDLADNPVRRDGPLLADLYRLPFLAPHIWADHPVVAAAQELWAEVLAALRGLPHYGELARVFEFDLAQFYNANRFSELLTDKPYLANQVENRAYCPHNMGIVLVGTIDLMAGSQLPRTELGAIRAFLHRAQEAARLMNVLTTLGRETIEGDVTGEIVATLIEEGSVTPTWGRWLEAEPALIARARDRLAADRAGIYRDLEKRAASIQSFDAPAYVDGLRALERLHEAMARRI